MDRIGVWRTRGHILQRTSRKATFLLPSVGCGFLTLCCVFIGSGQLAGVELESVSGGLSETDVGEIRDISAQHFIRFSERNPETTTEKTVVIKNTTWVTEQVLTNHLGVCERLLANKALRKRSQRFWLLWRELFRSPFYTGTSSRTL